MNQPIDRSGCTAVRHGTFAAYSKAGCRCPDAREICRIYRKRQREGRPYRRTVSAVGSARRIRALARIGHSMGSIGAALGKDGRTIREITIARLVYVTTADAIRDVYGRLADTPGESDITRRRAERENWPSPLAWEGVDIDDPDAEPIMDAHVDEPIVDEVAIQRAISGDTKVAERLQDHEREEAARLMLRRGDSAEQVRRLLGTSERTTRRIRQAVAA